MRKLAAELGVAPMTLYYHVPDKSALEDLVFDAVLGEWGTSPVTTPRWTPRSAPSEPTPPGREPTTPG
jgi:AcrR family transcriptional regulator